MTMARSQMAKQITKSPSRRKKNERVSKKTIEYLSKRKTNRKNRGRKKS